MSPRRFRVTTSPAARADLIELREYIALKSSRRTAANYIRRLKQFSAELAIAPHRGESHEHLRPGLRSIGFEDRVSILFAVFDDERTVEIESFLYGGRQRHETAIESSLVDASDGTHASRGGS